MNSFIPAFICIFCLMCLGILSLGIGLGLIDPLLGLLGVISCVYAMYGVSSSIEE